MIRRPLRAATLGAALLACPRSAAMQVAEELLAIALNDRQLDTRMPPDKAQQGIAKAPDRGREIGADDKLADQAGPCGSGGAGGNIQLGEHPACGFQESRTSGGRPNARGSPLEQRNAEFVLEPADPSADDGERKLRDLSREADAAVTLNMGRELKCLKID